MNTYSITLPNGEVETFEGWISAPIRIKPEEYEKYGEDGIKNRMQIAEASLRNYLAFYFNQNGKPEVAAKLHVRKFL